MSAILERIRYMSREKHLRSGSKLNQAVKSLFVDQSRDQGGLQAAEINESRTCGCNLTFDP